MYLRIRGCLCLALALVCLPNAGFAGEETPSKPAHFVGKLVVKKGPSRAVSLTCGGKTYPLVEDDGSRMLFADDSFAGRDVRLAGELVKGDQLRVVGVQTYVKGTLHEVYYWCASCELAYSGPGECLCCGEKVKLVEIVAGGSRKKPTLLLKPQ